MKKKITPLNVEKKDLEKAGMFSRLYHEVNKMPAKGIEFILDEIHEYQPMIIRILLGFQQSKDFTPAQLDEIIKLTAAIWLYDDHKKIEKHRLTEKEYESWLQMNINHIKLWESGDEENRHKTLLDHLNQHTDIGIFGGLLFLIMDHIKAFDSLTITQKTQVLIELKSLCESLDHLMKTTIVK